MLSDYQGKLKQKDVDWKWDKTGKGEKLTLTHIPTGKTVTEEIAVQYGFRRAGAKLTTQEKKKQVYDDLFDKLEEVVYGPQPK